jgi:hypothetical protein
MVETSVDDDVTAGQLKRGEPNSQEETLVFTRYIHILQSTVTVNVLSASTNLIFHSI